METWKDVIGYEGLYQVSDLGNVKSLNYKGKGYEQNLVTMVRKRDGYIEVGLCKDGKNQKKKVHRLVAEAFLPNPNGFPQVNHKDENKANNSADNLEWCTNQYNINYSVGLHPKRKSYYRKPTRWTKRVRQIDIESGEVIREYSCIQEVGKVRNNTDTSSIIKCCCGKYKTAFGYYWEFCND